jgi:hypothetical protein
MIINFCKPRFLSEKPVDTYNHVHILIRHDASSAFQFFIPCCLSHPGWLDMRKAACIVHGAENNA